MIIDPDSVDRDVSLDTDVCIVGSGAGGAVVAQALAARGRSVVVVEQGPYVPSAHFSQREEEMLALLYAEHGARTTVDATVAIAYGAVVGGSTVPSFCLCVRTPRLILEHWARTFGLSDIAFEALRPYFERVEALAHVHPLRPEDLNANNAKLRLGAERLGYRYSLPAHNRVDCLGCGYCALGCSYNRKADALTVQLPAASQHGAIIIPSCHVERITVDGGRAVGVSGRFVRAHAGERFALTVRAKIVVLAAGAIGSPELWLRSRLPNTHHQVGRNLHLHPMVVLGAEFDEEIAGWKGIPQAVIVDEFLRLDRDIEGGYLLMPFFGHPITTAALLPGCGRNLEGAMDAYPRFAFAQVVLHDRTAGRVELDSNGQGAISYHLSDEDRNDLIDGIRRLADIQFASGARRVLLPFNETVALARRGDYRAIEERPFRANDPLLLSYHPHGTLRMGGDPRRSVVNGSGATHEVPGLFVADASVFPTSVAVPPQLSVMAFALRTAEHVAEQL